MKEITTTHKVLTGIILFNVLLYFVVKSNLDLDIFHEGVLSLHRYVLNNHNVTNSSMGNVSSPSKQQKPLAIKDSTKNAELPYEKFCKLNATGGTSGCNPKTKAYYHIYTERCTSATKNLVNKILCSCIPETLVGWEPVSKILQNNQLSGIEPGGRWQPPGCQARQRVAIIVPYRNRSEHLRIFVNRMHIVLQRQQSQYQIFVVEQNKPVVFSRATLMNVGFLEANKSGKFDCFIFSDVDLLPEDDRNMYTCHFSPLHLCAYVSKFRYKVAYDTIFGGISAMSLKDVEKTNLFSNRFFGWGGEDDDLFHRIISAGLTMYRYPGDIGHVHMIKHKRDSTNKGNPIALDGMKHYNRKVYLNDGVKQTNYKLVTKELKPLYTLLTVNLLPPTPPESCLLKKGPNVTENKYLSCWGDSNFRTGKIDCCKQPSGLGCCHSRGPTERWPKKHIRVLDKSLNKTSK